MVARLKDIAVTPQEYLERERRAETKSEFYDGVIVAMSGASRQHDRIVGDIFTEINLQLRGGSRCEPFTGDMRVAVPACNRYFYPDVSVVCGAAVFEDESVDTLLNPTLIVEVLSPSTEQKDREEKFDCYKTIASLTTYLLVAQDRPLIEVHTRSAQANLWQYRRFESLGASVPLPAIGCELNLADLYARVSFPPESA